MDFGNFMFGKKAYNEQLPTRSQGQISGINNMLGMGLQGMQDPYQGFEPIANQAREDFQQSIPSLAARFTSLSPSAMRSSGFKATMGRAQQGLDTNLAAMRSQYGMQNRGQAMQMAQMGLTPTFENMYHPETGGLMGQMIPMAGQAALGLATGGIGNMMGLGGGMSQLLPLLMMLSGRWGQ